MLHLQIGKCVWFTNWHCVLQLCYIYELSIVLHLQICKCVLLTNWHSVLQLCYIYELSIVLHLQIVKCVWFTNWHCVLQLCYIYELSIMLHLQIGKCVLLTNWHCVLQLCYIYELSIVLHLQIVKCVWFTNWHCDILWQQHTCVFTHIRSHGHGPGIFISVTTRKSKPNPKSLTQRPAKASLAAHGWAEDVYAAKISNTEYRHTIWVFRANRDIRSTVTVHSFTAFYAHRTHRTHRTHWLFSRWRFPKLALLPIRRRGPQAAHPAHLRIHAATRLRRQALCLSAKVHKLVLPAR